MTVAHKKRGLTIQHRARVTGSTLMGRRVSSSYMRVSGLTAGPVRTLRVIELSSSRASYASNHSSSDTTLQTGSGKSASCADFFRFFGSICSTPDVDLLASIASPLPNWRSLKVQLHTEGARHFEYGGKTGVGITGEQPVKRRSSDAGISGELSKPFGPGYGTQCGSQKTRIIFTHAVLQMQCQFLFGSPLTDHIPVSRFCVAHSDLQRSAHPHVRPAGEASRARVGEEAHIKNVDHRSQHIHPNGSISILINIAKHDRTRYGLPVAANSVTGTPSPESKRSASSHLTTRSFFSPVFYGGAVWEDACPAGLLLPRSWRPAQCYRLSSPSDAGSSSAKGVHPMQHAHALDPSSNHQAIAIIGAELIAYRINRKPEQHARLLGLVQMADTLGALNATDRATLAASLECIGGGL